MQIVVNVSSLTQCELSPQLCVVVANLALHMVMCLLPLPPLLTALHQRASLAVLWLRQAVGTPGVVILIHSTLTGLLVYSSAHFFISNT